MNQIMNFSFGRALIVAVFLAFGVGQPSIAQEREKITVPLPDRGSPTRQADATQLGHDVHWTLSAKGDWNFDLEGRGQASTRLGNIVTLKMYPEGQDRPIRFFAVAPDDELTHINFAQPGTTDQTGPDTTRAGIGSLGANFLEADKRSLSSMRANLDNGLVTYLDGFARIDRRNNALIATYDATVVHCEDITEPPYVSEEPCLRTLGRPGRVAKINGCIASLDVLSDNPDACLVPFRVDRVTPPESRRNVSPNSPGVSVTFSEPIDLQTLGPAFTLFTLTPEGEELPVSGNWTMEQGSEYAFNPDTPLYSGTIYRARIKGGADGVQSRDGAVMEKDVTWTFTTQLDLADQAPDGEDPVRLHNFQVIRDGELTPDKPTLTRAYFTWQKHEAIAEEMQPDRFRVRVDPSHSYGRRVGQKGQGVGQHMDIWRHDDDKIFDKEDRRNARHTANFFGWRPPRQGGTLEWTIKPDNPFPDEAAAIDFTAKKAFEVWDTEPPEMWLLYTFARVGAWRDELPAAATGVAAHIMDTTASQIPSFFPHKSAQAYYTPSLPPITASSVADLMYDGEGYPVDAQGNRVDMRDCHETMRTGVDVLNCYGLAGIDDARDNFFKNLGMHHLIPGKAEICAMSQRMFPVPPPAPSTDRGDINVNQLQNHLLKEMSNWHQVFDLAVGLDATAPHGTVIVIFAPPDFMGPTTAGMALSMGVYQQDRFHRRDAPQIYGFPNMRVYVMALPDGAIDMDRHIQVHLHELAHEYGLAHNPGDAQPEMECPSPGADTVAATELTGRNADGIEAWRMTSDGLDGWNKSQDEGNAQAPDGTLVSMMWPFAMSTNLMSLQDAEYGRMQKSVAEGPGSVWREGSLNPLFHRDRIPLWQSRYARSKLIANDARQVEEQLIITGQLSSTGLYIRSIDRMPDNWPTPPSSGYQAELVDAEGRIIARAPVGLRAPIDPGEDRARDDPMGWARFRVALPLVSNADLLVIRQGERVRASLPVPTNPFRTPDYRIVATQEQERWLEWQVNGPVARVHVAYSPKGEAPWQTIHMATESGKFRLPLDKLAPGPEPTLRITAQTGMWFADDYIQLR